MVAGHGLEGSLLWPRVQAWADELGFSQIGVSDVDLSDAEPGLQAIGVSAGPQAHFEIASACVRKGLPVFIEKPPFFALSMWHFAQCSLSTGATWWAKSTSAFARGNRIGMVRMSFFIFLTGMRGGP